ncbi:hypothetical protein [Pedomonas sp. V897]|uniref:hypothetical protein n=1 Tax=Pedomonas sp. V897 TaxID=3446482 RepID=UPI003EE23E5D
MEQAGKKPSAKREADQFETRGYIITEDADLALKDVAQGLSAIAQIMDEHGANVVDLTGADFAAIFRTFSRQAKAIYDDAAFANKVVARSRDLH